MMEQQINFLERFFSVIDRLFMLDGRPVLLKKNDFPLAEQVRDVIAIIQDSRVKFINPAVTGCFGWDPQEIIGQDFSIFVSAKYRRLTRKMYLARMRGKKVMPFYEIEVIKKDGCLATVELSASVMEYDKRPADVVVLRDISSRKKIQEALQKSEENYHQLVENLQEVVFSVDNHGLITYISPPIKEMTGYDITEAINRPFIDFVHPYDRDKVMVSFQQAQQGRTQTNEFRLLHKSGDIRYVRVSGRLVMARGKLVRIFGLMSDITMQRQLNEALEESESKFRGILNSMADIVFVFDSQGRFTFYHAPDPEELYIPPQKFIGKKYTELMPAGICIQISQAIKDNRQKQNSSFDYEIEINGVKKWFSARFSPLFLAREFEGSVVVIRDISKAKKTEELLQQSLKLRTEFMNMVSHELRTPLSAINESISLAEEELPEIVKRRTDRYLDVARRNIDRLLRLINDMLDIEKLESGRMRFDIQQNNIEDLAVECYQTMLPLAKHKNLDIILDIEKQLPKISFDRDKITQVACNLVHNAVKFTEEGKIIIFVRKKDNFIEVAVQDSGPGVNAQDQQKIFDPFVQLSKISGGTGLGLAISRQIIEAHGGKIWAESQPGKGSVFYFTLPVS